MRCNRFKALSLGLLMAAAYYGSVRADEIESYRVRDWNIGAYSNDETKEFSHCAMGADYKNGISLLFAINREKQWFMVLANENWDLNEGDKYNFDIDLDGSKGTRWFGVAVNSHLLRVPLADSASLFELFSASQMMTIRAMSATFRFDLTNSRIGLEAVSECARRHIAKENSNPFNNNPFARAPKGPKSKASDEQLYSEGAIVMTNMLSEIGSVGHRLAPVQKLREDYKGYHAVWTGEGAAGTLRIVPDAAGVSQTAAVVLASSSEECDGKFASAKSVVEDKAVKIDAICQDKKDKVSRYNHVVIRRPEGGVYLFSVVALNEEEKSVKSAARAGDLILASVKK